MYDPGDKYKNVNIPDDLKLATEALGLAYRILDLHRKCFEKYIAAEQKMYTLGSIINPTLYNDMLDSARFKRNIKCIRATLVFLDELKEVAEEVESRSNV